MESQRKIFFGCNYNDKRIKSRFDQLKVRLENQYPLDCVIIDKQKKRPAKDIWREIREEIAASTMLVFDVSGFRPNVIIELGYAMAQKNEEQILVTLDERKKLRKRKPKWLLSDIPHLYVKNYKLARDLDKYVKQQIKRLPYIIKMNEFRMSCRRKSKKTSSSAPLYKCGNKIMRVIRDEGFKSHQQLKNLAERENCRLGTVLALLKRSRLIKKRGGKGQIYVLRDD